jgi:hypothetical protein
MNGGVDVQSIITRYKQWLTDTREVLHGIFLLCTRGNEGSVLCMDECRCPQLRFPILVLKLPRAMPESDILNYILLLIYEKCLANNNKD